MFAFEPGRRDGEAQRDAVGRRVERAGANARITFTGPGSVVNFRFTIPDVGEIERIEPQLPRSRDLAAVLRDHPARTHLRRRRALDHVRHERPGIGSSMQHAVSG